MDIESNPTTELSTFRFKTWRPQRAPSALSVDVAIDLVGHALNPDGWGKQRDFGMLPLFFGPGKTSLFTLIPHKVKRYKRVEVEAPTPSMFELAEEYRAVYRILRRAIRSGLRAKSVTYEGRRIPLSSEVLTTQYVSIFGAGLVRRFDKRVRVWINKSDFEQWLRETFAPHRKLTSGEIHLVSSHLISMLRSGRGRSLNRENVKDLIRQWQSISPNSKDVDEIMANLEPTKLIKGGRPMSARNWNTLVKDLIENIKDNSSSPKLA